VLPRSDQTLVRSPGTQTESASGPLNALQLVATLDREVRELAGKIEGCASPQQRQSYLHLLRERLDIRLVGEIGFNAGHSAATFLAARPNITVVSFDIGQHPYVEHAKRFIDDHFPGRHTLILGASIETLPRFTIEHPFVRFDLVLIDGAHDYETVTQDMVNVRPLAHDQTVVVMDDLTPWRPCGVGPTQAWSEAVNENVISEDERFQDGVPIPVLSLPESEMAARVWAFGRFLPPATPS
jgi:predicted O-methyltransferase YrrM